MKQSTIAPALIDRLRAARSVAVLTGAGISAESGVPTFRDAQTGLWSKFDPTELATPTAFRLNPRLVWEWYAHRRAQAAEAKPNAGHVALAHMEKMFPSFHLVTQNVDGLHQRAGSTNVTELHGNIFRTKCFEQNHPVAEWAETGEVPPRCPRCNGLLRPDIVWFEEMLPEDEIDRAVQASTSSDVFFSIGTSTLVYPAAALPIQALRAGATLVEINPDRTPITAEAHYALRGAAGVILPQIVECLLS